MPNNDEILNELEGFEDQWKQSQEAEDRQYKLLPEIAFRCGVQDYRWFHANSGTLGLELSFEVIEPKEYAGEILPHVFWITSNNLPYVKRDVKKLTGKSLESVKELHAIKWQSCFAEVVNRHEVNPNDPNQRKYNRVMFINAWNPSNKPGTGTKKDGHKTAPTATKKPVQQEQEADEV
jgi:hypothetical protein